jgi:hypothetical protein
VIHFSGLHRTLWKDGNHSLSALEKKLNENPGKVPTNRKKAMKIQKRRVAPPVSKRVCKFQMHLAFSG